MRPRFSDTTSTFAPAARRARTGTVSSTFSNPSAARTAIRRPLRVRLLDMSTSCAGCLGLPTPGHPTPVLRRPAAVLCPARAVPAPGWVGTGAVGRSEQLTPGRLDRTAGPALHPDRRTRVLIAAAAGALVLTCASGAVAGRIPQRSAARRL